MTTGVEQVTIIGVGLLGASFGLALKKRTRIKRIVGVGRSEASLEVALERGAIDEAVLDVKAGVSQADVVCIATPAATVVSMLNAAVAAAPSHTIFFDMASTKQAICDHASAAYPAPRRFVGCHPMAGGEKYGAAHAHPDLFAGMVCLVEDDNTIDAQVRERVCALWQAVEARVVSVDAAAHDALLAHTSHAPHIVAAAVAQIAADAGATQDFVGNGFRDVTRIAASRPELWRDICMENRTALCYSLKEMKRHIAAVESLLENKDAAGLQAFFESAVAARRRILES